MDIPLMYLGLYLNVSILTLRQPKLSFLCYSRSPPCVENFTSVCHICQVFKWSFYLHEIIKNALCVHLNLLSECQHKKLSVQLQINLE